jgi:ElaB/YqjD/DUF883 family membrane-anchored ribosome-binding protein
MASTNDVQSQISALRAEIAQLQKDLGERGSEAYETIRDRAGNAVEAARPAVRSATKYVRNGGTLHGRLDRRPCRCRPRLSARLA